MPGPTKDDIHALHVVTRLNVGGIARYLAMAPEAVVLLVRGKVEPHETEAVWDGRQIVLPALRRGVHPVRDAIAYRQLRRLLAREKPMVVHTHASKAGALGRLAARSLGVPWVHTFHGHVLDGYFGPQVGWFVRVAERLLARGEGAVTATGPGTAGELERHLGVPVPVLPPGITMPPPAPDARARLRREWGNPERVALAVGRAAEVKDHARFVAAARGAKYLPVIAGADHVPGALALGHVEAMQDVYAAADVVVSSSRREGTPFALLEAAWCGIPVVATPVGDTAWIVGKGGLVMDDLGGGLQRLRDRFLREEMGAQAARSVRKRFPAHAVAPRLLALYESLKT